MAQNAKLFAEQLNKCLDEIGAPPSSRDRSNVLSKLVDIPKQQAWALIEGQVFPDRTLLEKIAGELEVDPEALIKNK